MLYAMAFSFQDHFSKQASHYAEYRPDYPKSLFTYLASLTQSHERAWDCGTGNGQAAEELFRRNRRPVLGTRSSLCDRALPNPFLSFRRTESPAIISRSQVEF